jgi:hypothetical protein
MFVIMIIIFLNELKNITLSFLKINYLKDVADINIQKHCNNIYCEAETGRFNLAKNSYDLLLPNDNFNTKTYYYTILFVIVLLFIDLMYKFWKYNDLFIPYLSNINGEYFITYLKLFPYILSFLIVFILTVMIIRRYAPTSSKGYKAYFNTDNDVISDDIDTFNINVMLSQSKNIIIIFLILYLICGFLSSIPSIPHDSRIDGINYFYIAMAYIFILLLCFYMMVNIINITMTFTDNDTPNLEYIDFYEILWSEISELKVLSDNEFVNSINQKKDILFNKDGNIIDSTRITAYVIYNTATKFAKLLREMTSEEKESIKHVIHTYIANIFDNPDNIDDIKDSTPLPFNETINRLILVESIDNKSIYNFLGLKNNSADELSDDENKVTNHKDNINILCNLTKVLIKKDLVNEYDKINVNKSNIKNTTKAFTDSYGKYMKEKRKVKLFYSISKLQNNYNKKEEKLNNKDAYEFIREYKGKLENYKQDINKEVNEYNLYLDNPKMFKDPYETEQTYTVDISYNSKNKYYENYFKIANGEKLHIDYNIGEYKIKNMEDLLSYIMFVIILSFVLLLIIYNITTNTNSFNSYNLFTSEIITPFLLIFIFVLFIYIFINYNTKYNLYFINGIFDSCYKRDLTHLNNKLIPFIKLHDKNADIISNDYLDHYIITNVFTSIINGDLILEATGKYENPLKLDNIFKDYAIMSSMNVQLKLYNDVDTSDKVKFDDYYSKIYEETYSYFEGDNKDFKNNGIPGIYTFVESIPKEDKTVKIVDETVTNSSDIDSYCKYIINKYKDNIIIIINICKHIFNPNNFKKNISEYNDNIANNKENVLMSYFKFELSENKMEAIPYKFLLNINANNLGDFLSLANKNNFNISENNDDIINNKEKTLVDAETTLATLVQRAYSSTSEEQANANLAAKKAKTEAHDALLNLHHSYKPIENIVNNFLLITAHMKYNYEILKKHIPETAITNIIADTSSLVAPMNTMINTDDNPELKNALHKLHWYENIKLFGLLTESLYKNDNTQIEIADTFNPTFKPDETKGKVHKTYTELNYTFNMLNNYEAETNNISNNYLKNVIKSIYKDINNSDIKFRNDDSDDKFEFKIDKSNLADPVDSILHKANNITGEGFLINYITNIIIIIMMYNIGNNI